MVWDAGTGEQYFTLDRAGAKTAIFTRDGSTLVSVGPDSTLRFWDAKSGDALRNSPIRAGTHPIAFTPDGSRIASVTGGGAVWIWDTDKQRQIQVLEKYVGTASSIVFSPDGTRLALASDEQMFEDGVPRPSPGAVRVWDIPTGRIVSDLQGHTDSVVSIAFSPDGTRLASASLDGTVRIWEINDGRLMHRLEGHDGAVHDVTFDPKGTRIASAGKDGTVRIWETTDGHNVLTIVGHTSPVRILVFSPDGSRLVSAADNPVNKLAFASELKVWSALSLGGR
jgi:WD40 repeat protein